MARDEDERRLRARGGHVLARNRLCILVPCHRVVAAGGIGSTAHSASATSGGCWRSNMSLSEDLRGELAQIAPRSDCDRLAELSGLFHSAGRLHLRGRGAVSVHLDVSDSSVARRAFRVLASSAWNPRSARTTGARSTMPSATSSMWKGERTRFACSTTPACSTRATRPWSGRRAASFVARAAAARTFAARCWRRLAQRSASTASGDSRDRHRWRGVPLRPRCREGLTLGVLDRGRHAVAYAKGAEAIADVLSAAGANDAVLVFEERAVVGATRSRANRLANATTRTSCGPRAAHVQAQAARRLTEEGRLEALSPRLREAAELRLRHPSLSLRELASKCRPPITKAALHQRLTKVVRAAGP